MARYWIQLGAEPQGPYSPEQLRAVAGLTADSPVCPEGSTGSNDWRRLKDVPGLVEAIGPLPAPVVPAPVPALMMPSKGGPNAKQVDLLRPVIVGVLWLGIAVALAWFVTGWAKTESGAAPAKPSGSQRATEEATRSEAVSSSVERAAAGGKMDSSSPNSTASPAFPERPLVEIPTSLAGLGLGAPVKDCEARGRYRKLFDVLDCKTTAKGNLWGIRAPFLAGGVNSEGDTNFNDLLAERQNKLGPPTKISQDFEDCEPPWAVAAEESMPSQWKEETLGLKSQYDCAIWQNAHVRSVLYSHKMEDRSGTSIQTYGLILIDLPLMTKYMNEVAAEERSAEAKKTSESKKKAQELMNGE